MSTYATLAELKTRLGSRTSPAGLYEQMTDRVASTTANDTIGQALLDDAEAVVNAKIAARYSVPVDVGSDSVAAAFLKRAALIIATFNGWSEHPKLSQNRETIKTSYDEVMKQLSAIASGSAELPAATTLAAASTTAAIGQIGSADQIFTDDAMERL